MNQQTKTFRLVSYAILGAMGLRLCLLVSQFRFYRQTF